MLKYLSQVEALSYEFIKLLAEALGLKSDALSEFFDEPGNLQHRAKVRVFQLCTLCLKWNLIG
jgi:isopenicillin N synthase-like dioxygenase